MGLSILKKNILSHSKFKKKELKFKILKILIYNFKLQLKVKTFSLVLLKITKIKIGQNICFLSGKNASVYKPWNLARNFFRRLLEKKLIFGIKKTSW